MNNQEIINYVMNTPGNTNPTILNQMLNSREISWNDIKDKPFYVEEERTLLCECNGEDGQYPIDIKLEEGKEYTVIVDEMEYIIKCMRDETGDLYLPICHKENYPTIYVYENEVSVGVDTIVHKIELLEYREIRKLDAKYLPDPFWVEEKRILVVEGVPDNGNYNVQTTLVEGEEYTYIIDGVEYTGKCFYDEPDRCVYLPDPMNTVAIVYEYGISMRKEEGQDVFHKIERAEKVYHTHHDFMAIVNEDDDTGEREVKLVAGDFATTKAKILKGLSATAYICGTFYGEGWKEVTNYVTNVTYYQEDGKEGCNCDVFNVLPHNIIE